MKGIDKKDQRLALKSRKNIKMGKGIVGAGIALTLSLFTMEKSMAKPVGKIKFTSLKAYSQKKIVEEDIELKIESDAYDMIRASLS